MRTNIFIMTIVFALTIGAGIMLAKSVAWVRHGNPKHEVVTIDGESMDQRTIKSKKWLTTEAGKDYFYRTVVEYTYKRGAFPFIDVDTLIVTPSEIWEKKHY